VVLCRHIEISFVRQKEAAKDWGSSQQKKRKIWLQTRINKEQILYLGVENSRSGTLQKGGERHGIKLYM